MDYKLRYFPLKPQECDIGLAFYKYVEATYAKNPGKWLNESL